MLRNVWRCSANCRRVNTSPNTCFKAVHNLYTIPSLCRGRRAFANVPLRLTDTLLKRHIGPSTKDVQKMLDTIGVASLDELITATVPQSLRHKEALDLEPALSETEALAELKAIMDKNMLFTSHIGQGYYGTLTPKVILRNMLENPAWYTAYTPYSAEISQGRMEMLLNYQTMVSDLTGVRYANASLLDEGTAAAEAVAMCVNLARRRQVVLVSDTMHPQTLSVVETRAESVGIEVIVQSPDDMQFDSSIAGVLLQYPNTFGHVEDYRELVERAHEAGANVAVATDLLALTVLTPPGEWGADIVFGNAQRMGVPYGFGGPHAAFFACHEKHKRKIPGRIIGISKDTRGQPALRMAMQTREQHIRRDKATSNICTAQALLANVNAAYAVYHGPEGLTEIAKRVLLSAQAFAAGLATFDIPVAFEHFFDTVHIDCTGIGGAESVRSALVEREINIRVIDSNFVCVSFDETHTASHINALLAVFGKLAGSATELDANELAAGVSAEFPGHFKRSSSFLTHPVFNSYHSETELLRYLYKLESRDLSLTTAMIPLGSCTMKLNATTEMIPITWEKVNAVHPFVPPEQRSGYRELLDRLELALAKITQFDRISFQPNSGAQGEYTGLLTIRAYHRSRGDANRNVCLIPTSAHGTNPASAVMCGLKVVVVKCDANGNIDQDDMKAKVEKHKDNLAALMITYPSTHGVFEEGVCEMIDMIHENGGQVYMDGANMNAQVGLTSPGAIGADVCHLNLHKTFCIPHGGGGPGMGPIGVAKHLTPFLPAHDVVDMVSSGETDTQQSCGSVAAAPWASASILPISWLYIRMMGTEGLTYATKIAILNANYMAARLRDHYNVLYKGASGFVAHEFILDMRPFKALTGVVEEDVAKRLMDYNFHAPTMSWPVMGTLMIEPTESESLYELDRMVDAMLSIRAEIRDVEEGKVGRDDNVLKNAPHTADLCTASKWSHPYTREQAAFPTEHVRDRKFWPAVTRIDAVWGDKNVMCTCPPVESFTDQGNVSGRKIAFRE